MKPGFRIRLDDGRELPGRTDSNLLQQLQAAGLDLPEACRNGHCGRCHARLLSGQLVRPRERQSIPLCISYADSDITLALPEPTRWRLFACQLVGQHGAVLQLRLPAGRCHLPGESLVTFNTEGAAHAHLLDRDGRLLRVQGLSMPTFTGQAIVKLLSVAAPTGGAYALCYQDHTLLTGLNQDVARELCKSLLQSGLDADVVRQR